MSDEEDLGINSNIKRIPSSVAKLIGSCCVITSPVSVVKELIDNSVDAEAKVIEVKLESFGLNRIEVVDDGCGLSSSDAHLAALEHFTSKLKSADLSEVKTYGFRGVALSSICQVADLSIVTKTANEGFGRLYKFNENGKVISQSIRAATSGCLVVVSNLFKNLPVRQQYFNNVNKKKDVIKQIESIIKSYGVVLPHLRFNVYHDKKLIWQKFPSANIKISFQQLFQHDTKNQWDDVSYNHPINKELEMYCVLPLKTSKIQVTSRSHSQFSFVYVNKRPVEMKLIHQLVKRYYNRVYNLIGNQRRNPCYVISIKISSEDIDINVDPDKKTVFLRTQVQTEVQTSLKEILQTFYDIKIDDDDSADNSFNLSSQRSCSDESQILNNSTEMELEVPELEMDLEVPELELTQSLCENEVNFEFSEDKMTSENVSSQELKEYEPDESIKNQKRVIISQLDRSQPAKKLRNIENNKQISTQKTIQFPKIMVKSANTLPAAISSESEIKNGHQLQSNQQKEISMAVNGNLQSVSKCFNMEKLRSMFASGRHKIHEQSDKDEIQLVGQLLNGTWIVHHNKVLSALNYSRLQETVLYHKLLSTHKVKSLDLTIPTVITER
ncbi:ATP-binding mismatch repair protein, variant 2 [Chamberlinius hualienensis]